MLLFEVSIEGIIAIKYKSEQFLVVQPTTVNSMRCTNGCNFAKEHSSVDSIILTEQHEMNSGFNAIS